MNKKIVFMGALVILMLSSGNRLHCQEAPRILLDEYHASVSPLKFAEFLEVLHSKGYTTEIAEERINSSVLSRENYDAFVLFAPRKTFSDEEEAAIMNFVEDGGGLIIFGEGGSRMRNLNVITSINRVSKLFGIQFDEDTVIDAQRKIEGFKLEEQLVISTFTPHPVTRGVESIGYLYGCSLTLTGSATPLAFGAPTTTADGKKGKEVVVLAAVEYGEGRVLAMGDYDFLFVIPEGDFLSILDNKKLGLNMFEWVSQPRAPVVLPPVTAEADELASEGYTLFSQREYSSAQTKFEEALERYTDVNAGQKVSEMQEMVAQCREALYAEDSYQMGMEYYSKKEYENALAEFEKSAAFYSDVGDDAGTQDAQAWVTTCRAVIDAEDAYERGMESYNRGEYSEAASAFKESWSLYDTLEDVEGSTQARSMAQECGDTLFNEGIALFGEEQYESAEQKFGEALEVFSALGDEEKIQECNEQIESCRQALEPPPTGFCLGTVLLIFMVLSGLVVVQRRR